MHRHDSVIIKITQRYDLQPHEYYKIVILIIGFDMAGISFVQPALLCILACRFGEEMGPKHLNINFDHFCFAESKMINK